MGNNLQVNTTFTAKNYSNATNRTIGYTTTQPIPLFRPPQDVEDIWDQLRALACVCSLTFAINLFMVIFTSVKLKAVPYMFIQNFMVIDIVSAMVTAGPWATGVWLDFYGLSVLTFLCRIQGFFHNTLATVFLGTVTAIAASRYLYVESPLAYTMFFVNKPVVRLLLFTIWFGAGFLASPPLNPGTWGAYNKLEGTCWMSWEAGNLGAVTYSAFHTIITLGPAVIFTALAIVFIVLKKKNSIHPAPPAPSMQLNNNQPGLPPPTPTMTGSTRGGTHFLNLEVLYISCALLLLYLVTWTAMTVVESLIIVDWRTVDYKVVIVLTFLYQSRGLIHPFLYLLLSAEMRNAFVKCTGKGQAGITLSTDAGALSQSIADIQAHRQ
ncbi:melatonin receptor type 1A-like [Orbicella faveolata]|uniref:melatonin receptor type 1A-like n=1 Tax=Orbicella faveolata TaxID=48498 RepID=UPI0009E5EB5C|nr:melatonin receptor type 1A-like [Orbicella faveolata]